MATHTTNETHAVFHLSPSLPLSLSPSLPLSISPSLPLSPPPPTAPPHHHIGFIPCTRGECIRSATPVEVGSGAEGFDDKGDQFAWEAPNNTAKPAGAAAPAQSTAAAAATVMTTKSTGCGAVGGCGGGSGCGSS